MTYFRPPVKAWLILLLFSDYSAVFHPADSSLPLLWCKLLVYLTPITPVFCISQIDLLFKLFWDGNCLPFIFTLWVFPRTLLSLPHSFSLHPWQPAFLSPFMVHVIICQMTNHCIPLFILSPYISLILSLLFFFSFFHWLKNGYHNLIYLKVYIFMAYCYMA